jgi:hypothetical protein
MSARARATEAEQMPDHTSAPGTAGLARSGEGTVSHMELDLGNADLHLSLPLDAHAPSEARHAVGRVDKPSPDLRDAVVLLTSELVTRALRHSGGEPSSVELRVWMPREIARVEVWAERKLLHHEPAETNGDPEYDLMLLDQTSDRWAIERRGERICAWFEIDRRRPVAAPGQVHPPIERSAA